MALVTWIATAIAIIGSILNAKRNIVGFYFWLLSNFMYAMINAYLNIWAQSILFVFNMGVCVWGLINWKKE